MKTPALRQPGSLTASAYIFAGIFLLRLFVLLRLTASPFLLPSQGDMHFYDDWAQRIAHGQWTDYHAFYGLPLYPYLLALIYKLFGYNPFLPGLLQACADSGTGVLIYKLSARLFGQSAFMPNEQSAAAPTLLPRGGHVGLLAAAAWSFYLPEQAYSAILMPTSLAIFVFWFVLGQIVKHRQTPSPFAIFLLGALIGSTAMGIATVLFLIPLLLAAIFFRWENRHGLGKRLLSVALLFFGLGLGVTPCWTHNYFVAHDHVLLSAHSGVNFWIGNNPAANGYPRMPPGLHAGQEAMLSDSITVAQEAAGRELKRSEVSDYWTEKARTFIRENPGAWLKLTAQKMINFWNAFQYDDLSIITNLRIQGVLLPGIKFGLVAALGLAGLGFAIVKAPGSRWIVAAILLQMASLLSVFVTERYRLAATPGLLVFASFGLFDFWNNSMRERYRPAVGYLLVLSLATLFVSIPRKDRSLWALDPYNSGWQALQTKDYAFAKEKLQLAYAYVPENAEVNFALGNLQLELQDKAGAKSYYASTLRLDPTHEGALNNLGVLALEEQLWPVAAKFFQGALRASPNDPKTHYLLARTLFEQGDLEQAQIQVDLALRLKPAQPEFAALRESIRQRR